MIAVTGANGLLGNFIVKKLLDEGQKVVGIKRKGSKTGLLEGYYDKVIWKEADILDSLSLEDAIKDAAIVIHAAANLSFHPKRSKEIFTVNVEGTKNVVNACLKLGIPRLIHVSSVAALGRQKGVTRLNEQSKWVENSMNSPYAESKYLAELEVFRGQEEGLRTAIVNPSIILAPGDWTKSSAQLFKYVWDQKLFYTSGSLNYVDARDVAEMICRLCTSSVFGERVIASGGTATYQSVFFEIAKRFKRRPPLIHVGATVVRLASWVEEVRSFVANREPMFTRQSSRMACETFSYDNAKARELLGVQFTSLKDTLDWCCSHYLRYVSTNK